MVIMTWKQIAANSNLKTRVTSAFFVEISVLESLQAALTYRPVLKTLLIFSQ